MNWIEWIISLNEIKSNEERMTLESFIQTITAYEFTDINHNYLLNHINHLLNEYTAATTKLIG